MNGEFKGETFGNYCEENQTHELTKFFDILGTIKKGNKMKLGILGDIVLTDTYEFAGTKDERNQYKPNSMMLNMELLEQHEFKGGHSEFIFKGKISLSIEAENGRNIKIEMSAVNISIQYSKEKKKLFGIVFYADSAPKKGWKTIQNYKIGKVELVRQSNPSIEEITKIIEYTLQMLTKLRDCFSMQGMPEINYFNSED